eukprot:scaffold66993_cov77-Phaeocystis_antarctica.AAC.1
MSPGRSSRSTAAAWCRARNAARRADDTLLSRLQLSGLSESVPCGDFGCVSGRGYQLSASELLKKVRLL